MLSDSEADGTSSCKVRQFKYPLQVVYNPSYGLVHYDGNSMLVLREPPLTLPGSVILPNINRPSCMKNNQKHFWTL